MSAGASERRGYCYHDALLAARIKDSTLVRKLRDRATSSKLRPKLAWELSMRDPALALAEVTALAAEPWLEPALASRCLHHVADVALARVLFERADFDPDGLHLTPLAAVADHVLAAIPTWSADEIVARVRRLGFLGRPPPNPFVDGPRGTARAQDSYERCTALIVRVARALFDVAALAPFRVEIATTLARTYADDACRFVLARGVAAQVPARLAVGCALRLGRARAIAEIGEPAWRALLAAFAREPLDRDAVEYGFLPERAQELPLAEARTLLLAILDAPPVAELHARAAALVLAGQTDGRALVLARAPALVPQPPPPREREDFDAACRTAPQHPGPGCEALRRIAADVAHPDADRAFAALVALASTDAPARRYALYELGQLRDRRAEPVLRGALADPATEPYRLLVTSALDAVAAGARA